MLAMLVVRAPAAVVTVERRKWPCGLKNDWPSSSVSIARQFFAA
jgi:hypothetical protein